MTTWTRPFVLAVCLLPFLATPAFAAGSPPIFADYWDGLADYWTKAFQRRNGVVLGILAVGAVALFIITRGKWQK